jgi:hypothetical protein
MARGQEEMMRGWLLMINIGEYKRDREYKENPQQKLQP